MELSERIRTRRNELGLTLLEISQRIGVTEPTVQRYESGEIKNLKYETIIRLAEALDWTPAQLMGWEKENPAQKLSGVDDELYGIVIQLSPEKQRLLLSLAESWLGL